MEDKYRFRGRFWSEKEIERIKKIIADNPGINRNRLSKIICNEFNWLQPNGRIKDMACREVLLRMHEKKLINCPARKKRRNQIKEYQFNLLETKVEENEIIGKISDYKELRFEMVRFTEKEKIYRYLIDKYHYLGYKINVGRHIKYLIYLDELLVGAIGFADGILHLNLRDKWIGWSKEYQEKNLHLVINNNRYLIAPWIHIKHLSSKILGKIARIIRNDWGKFYGYKPVIMETFVETDRFAGTSYKAANWIYLGSTNGKGRKGLKYFYHGKIKDVYVYPLIKDFREELTK